jgi:elongation factor G
LTWSDGKPTTIEESRGTSLLTNSSSEAKVSLTHTFREEVQETDIPEQLLASAKKYRQRLVEALAEVDMDLSDLVLMDSPISSEDIADAIRRATVACRFSPVFVGSAIKNTGVQPLLDGVVAYLPDPSEVEVKGFLTKPSSSVSASTSESIQSPSSASPATTTGTQVTTSSDQVIIPPSSTAPLLLLTFKLEESKFGQLTYVRVYSGTLKRGAIIHQARTGKKVKVPRLVRMHSDEMEDVEELKSGEIGGVFGVECASGDTFWDGKGGAISMVRV